MSSPRFGFSTWRGRSLSYNPDDNQQEQDGHHHDDPQNDLRRVLSNPHPHATPIPSSLPSVNRDPIRFFIHGSTRDHLAPLDSVLYAKSVRDESAELATYLLSDQQGPQTRAVLSRQRAPSTTSLSSAIPSGPSRHSPDNSGIGPEPENSHVVVAPVSEQDSANSSAAQSTTEAHPYDGPSMLTEMIRRSPPQSQPPTPPELKMTADELWDVPVATLGSMEGGHSRKENTTRKSVEPANTNAGQETPLLGTRRAAYYGGTESGFDAEGQKVDSPRKGLGASISECVARRQSQAVGAIGLAFSPSSWNRETIWRNCFVEPVSSLPAVIVGLLLNVLDALSYGMILFPLGDPLFAHLGSAGISIYYVSTIISQLTFSTASVFKGAIGSELIEVVPFFHGMAKTITRVVGRDNPDAVIATTITSYALSSMLTGVVFYSMGKFKLGSLVGFIPRHILIGCIGGVGWFLVATGFEVTARLGSFHYNLDTAHRLIQMDTLPLWLIPFALSIILFYSHSRVKSKYFLPAFILSIPLLFYISIFASKSFNPDFLREQGWIFDATPSGEPWWYFYTLYKFGLVRWDAIAQCIPAMFALTFFGILHVPINVPALALQTGEDHASLDHELRLHGLSNLLSGMAGSIQNYLVYANTVMFMRCGGDTRLAGFELAVLTFLVMMIGPYIIGFIPIMMVGTLIFDIGFELLLESVWLPRKKLKVMEYLTVIVIVLVMGTYDFVIGIGVGILLAFATLVFQTSRISAVRNNFTGDIVGSTVRRNPTQHHYLKDVGRQVYIMKLSGYLFFGTIASVEDKIRSLVSDEAFDRRPFKFLVLDLWHVTGIDYSAGEAFNTISRLVGKKDIVLTISGVDPDSGLGRNLRTMGIGEDDYEVMMLPTLNSALESCENELLKTFYVNQEEAHSGQPASSLEVPSSLLRLDPFNMPDNSPRTTERTAAAKTAIEEHQTIRRAAKWQHFKEPLRLMLQIFQDLSGKNEDFWFRAVDYFVRRHYGQGTVLFRAGDQPDGFWLLEKGVLRAENNLPQGFLCESIVAGTTFGELAFFGESRRAATVVAERECVTWLLTRPSWERMQEKEPEMARELLRVGLKLTSERMEIITSYTLAMAG